MIISAQMENGNEGRRSFMKEEVELKSCPFCGGKAKVAKVHPSFMLKKLHYMYFAAGCTNCNVTTPLFPTRKTGSPLMNQQYDEEAKQKAIEAWNKRVDGR